MLRGFLALAVTLLLLAACDDGGDPPGPEPSPTASTQASACSPARPATAGSQQLTIMSGGVERSYILHVPASYDGSTPAPLIFLLHGLSMPADLMVVTSDMPAKAEAYGAIVVTPQALGEVPVWNVRLTGDMADDVAFVDDLLAQLTETLCVADSKVFAAGLSNGGGMAQRLACDRPDTFAAVGLVAATYLSCRAGTAVIAFHGDADPLVPYEGGETPPSLGSVTFPPVRRALSEWARGLGCDGLALISRDGGIEVSTFVNCPDGDEEALLYTVLGGGHTWPGSPIEMPPHIVGMTTQEIDATALMLEFFLDRDG